MTKPQKPVYYNFFWRWHFYAGLIAMPTVLVMAITGAIYQRALKKAFQK